MQKILYISLTGMTEPLGRSQVLEYLAGLSKKHNIRLLSFERQKDADRFEQIRQFTSEHDIVWHYFIYSNRYGIFSTLVQILRALQLASGWIRQQQIDIIHARSMIPATIGLLLKKMHGIRLLFDIRGFLIDEKVDSRRLRKDSLMYTMLKKLDNYLYRSSDHIVTLTRSARDVLTQTLQLPAEKITVIPTCANRELFSPLHESEQQALRTDLGFTAADKIIIHTGTVLNRYDFSAEVKFFKKLLEKDKSYKFLIVNKDEHEFIEKTFHNFHIDPQNYAVLSSSFEQMHRYLNIADFSLFCIPPTYAKKAMAPTKFAENVACHLPTITNPGVGDMTFFLETYNVGLLVDFQDPDTDFDTIASGMARLLQKGGSNPDYNDLFDHYFDKSIAIRRYDSIYRHLKR